MTVIYRGGRSGGRFHCNDGWSISVIWGEMVYCTPRKDDALFYLEVEAGFPSWREDSLKDYAESPEYTDTVYPYIPVEILLEAFQKHGGVSTVEFYPSKSFKMAKRALRAKLGE